MELTQNVNHLELYGTKLYQEIKPMKGIDFNLEVQRFEQALKLNGFEEMGSFKGENIVSNFDGALFDKISEYKISVDSKLDAMHMLFNSEEPLNEMDLIKAQYQVGMFTVEVTVVSNGSDKVSDGIVTLFQTK